jgi:glycosyltransferase involved in cell wall biosynthesis
MQVLYILPFFTPSRGGSVEVPCQMAKSLSEKGHKITIVTTDFEFNKTYAASLEAYGVHIIAAKCVANLGLFLYSPSLKSWLNENVNKFDVVHMHNYRSYQNIIACASAKKHGIPFVLQPHGSLPKIVEKKTLKTLFDVFWGRKIINAASKIIAVSNTEVNQFKKFGVDPSKIVTIPNGLDLQKYSNLPPIGKFREKYGIKEKHMILYLGRIHKIKGIDLLIKSFNSFTKETNNAILVIAGPDAGYLRTLEKLAKELRIEKKILFTGPLYDMDKLEAYVDADVYVLPSIYEAFPVTLLEACACSTPVITTDRCGLADIIDGQAGLVVPYNENALCRALSLILGDEAMRQEFGKKGKLLVREQFNLEKISKQIETLYQSILH